MGDFSKNSYQTMISQKWLAHDESKVHKESSDMRICICVRKRPLFEKEAKDGNFDCVSVANPMVRVHEPKMKVDGITRYIDTIDFQIDNAYHELEETEGLYQTMVNPVIESLFCKGIVTCFAYGQTGSGKTYTMKDVQASSIRDLFALAEGKY